MFRYTILLAAALAGSGLNAPASAAVMNYGFDGTFKDGATMVGYFSIDDNVYGNQQDRYSNVNVKLSGYGTTDIVWAYGFSCNGICSYLLFFGDPNVNFNIQLAFDGRSYPFLQDIRPGALNADATFYSSKGSYLANQLSYGKLYEIAAVPEPGSWLLMLTGLAGTAYALRRNLRKMPLPIFSGERQRA
jgi:hypothetical protein